MSPCAKTMLTSFVMFRLCLFIFVSLQFQCVCCRSEHLRTLVKPSPVLLWPVLFLTARHFGPSSSLYPDEFQACIFISNPFLKLQCHISHFLCFRWPHHFNLCVPNHNQFLFLFQRITEDVSYWKDPLRNLVQSLLFCKNETIQPANQTRCLPFPRVPHNLPNPFSPKLLFP